MEQFLARVERVKASGQGFEFCCPCHGDNDPSASASYGDKGIVAYCHACGASGAQMASALGMAASDLYYERIEQPMPRAARRNNGNGVAALANANEIIAQAKAMVKPANAVGGGRPFVRRSPNPLTTEAIREMPHTQSVYIYTTPSGDPHLLIRRFVINPDGADGKPPKKIFHQYHALDDGRWEMKAPPGELYPYRVIDVQRAVAEGRTVYVAEGEKCAEALIGLGLTATCNPMGAGKWYRQGSDYAQFFVGAALVVVFADPDDPGQRHALDVARSLNMRANEIRIVQAPTPADPAAAAKYDVADWVADGATAEDVWALVAATPAWRATAADLNAIAQRTRLHNAPVITIDSNTMRMADLGLEALLKCNDPPVLFHTGSTLVRLERVNGTIDLVPVTVPMLRADLARAATWATITAKPGYPSTDVAQDILGRTADQRGFPELERIIHVPAFDRNGRLIDRPGYDPESRLYLDIPAGFKQPSVPAEPTQSDVKKALAMLRDELLGDFCFDDACSRANALAALFESRVQLAIDHIMPLKLVDAPTEGSGKGKLANALIHVGAGSPPDLLPVPAPKAEEWAKLITSVLIKNKAAALLDNIDERGLESGVLAALLTSTTFSGRLLATNRNPTLRNSVSWWGTGNNVQMSKEISRRTVLIRLDPGVENPEERTGFRHPDLDRWVARNLGQLSWAVCVIIRAWFAAGAPEWKIPKGAAVIGSYERWCRVLGGILDVIGVNGFLQNREKTRGRADQIEGEWRRFMEAWIDELPYAPAGVPSNVGAVTVPELYRKFFDDDTADEYLLGIVRGERGRPRQTSLGMHICSRVGKVLSCESLKRHPGVRKGYRIVEAGRHRHRSFRIECVDDIPAAPNVADGAMYLAANDAGDTVMVEEWDL
jgi:hypothetical protein